MVLAKQDLLDFIFTFNAKKKKRRFKIETEQDLRDYLRLQEELRAAREKARLFDLLHRNRMF
jgi:hypothetical protein